MTPDPKGLALRFGLAFVGAALIFPAPPAPAAAPAPNAAQRAWAAADASLRDAEWEGAQAQGDLDAARACESGLRAALDVQRARADQSRALTLAGQTHLAAITGETQAAARVADAAHALRDTAELRRDQAAAALDAAQAAAIADFEAGDAVRRAVASAAAARAAVDVQTRRVLSAVAQTPYAAQAQSAVDADADVRSTRIAAAAADAALKSLRDDFRRTQLPRLAAVQAAAQVLTAAESALAAAAAQAQAADARLASARASQDAATADLRVDRNLLQDADARTAQLQSNLAVAQAAQEAAGEHQDSAARALAAALHDDDDALWNLRQEQAQAPWTQPFSLAIDYRAALLRATFVDAADDSHAACVPETSYWLAHPREADLRLVQLDRLADLAPLRQAQDALRVAAIDGIANAQDRAAAKQRWQERQKLQEARHRQIAAPSADAAAPRFLPAAPTVVLPQAGAATQPAAASR